MHRFRDDKTELEQKLRERFDELLEKVKDSLEKGKALKEDVIQKVSSNVRI